MYLDHRLVLESFKRLRTNSATGKRGKTPMERTSSLMIMLAANALMKRFGTPMLDIDFSRTETDRIRRELALQYARFVSVGDSEDGMRQAVYEFGRVKTGGKDPANRISSNFITTQVVAATKSDTPFEYPRRPAPLLHLGKAATDVNYGVRLHPEWRAGMEKHLSEVASNTPFTDLAMFCLRLCDADKGATLTATLSEMLEKTFTQEVANFWKVKVINERKFARHLRQEEFMESKFVDSLATLNDSHTRRNELMGLDKSELVEMVMRLENSKRK